MPHKCLLICITRTLTILIGHDENGTVDATSLNAQNQRRHQIASRLSRGAPAAAPGLATPLQELVGLRANTSSTSTFMIFVEIRRSSAPASVDKVLGKSCAPRPEGMTLLGGFPLSSSAELIR